MPSVARSAKEGTHVPYVLGLAALAILWTWPLVLHFSDRIPGFPGDNFSFLWNLWWMRHAVGDSALSFFRSPYLFSPFGVDLVNHPHTALQGFVSATLLGRLSIVQAENLYILVSIFLNAIAAYALVFDVSSNRRLALLGAIAFGDCPYIAAHLLGHFDLLTAWVIPMFAWCLRRALVRRPALQEPGPPHAITALAYAIGCGLSLTIAAYSAYYHVVYLALFGVTYVIAWWNCLHLNVERRRESTVAFSIRLFMVAVFSIDLAIVTWILITGGSTLSVLGSEISVRGLHNPILIAWVCAIVWLLARWRVRVTFAAPGSMELWTGVQALLVMVAVFLVLSFPLIVQAARVVLGGRYVTQPYFWRSVPLGIDLVTIVAGNPSHPLLGGLTRTIYSAFTVDRIEQIGWIGLAAMVVLLMWRGHWSDREEAHRWKAVLLVFAIWSLGPFLVIAGRNVDLPLPEALARFIPFVDNARMPGRAMVGVYLALAVLMALRIPTIVVRGFSSAAIQWLAIVLVAFDFLNAPVPLTPLDRPAVYQRLAAITDDAPMIEVPFGIGDGLSTGIGAQDRRVLYYATLHGHPMVGGFIGRMPPDVAQAYLDMPVVGDLLRLSNGAADARDEEPTMMPLPFRYLVLDTAKASPELVAYVHRALDLDLLERSEGKELYAVQGMKPASLRASRPTSMQGTQ